MKTNNNKNSISVIYIISDIHHNFNTIYKQNFNLKKVEFLIINNSETDFSFKYPYILCNDLKDAVSKSTGKYLTIIQSTDDYSKHYFSKMFKYSEEVNPIMFESKEQFDDINDVDDEVVIDFDNQKLPPIPIVCPKHINLSTKIEDRFSYGKEVQGIDLRKNNASSLRFPLQINGIFFKNEIIKNIAYNKSLNNYQFMDYIMQLLLEYRLLLAVNTEKYFYTNIVDMQPENTYNIEIINTWLLPLIKANAKPHSKKIPVFLQAFSLNIIINILSHYKDNSSDYSLSKSESKDFWELIKKVLFYIDENTIDRIIPNELFELKLYFVRLKNNCLDSEASVKPIGRLLLLSYNSRKSFITSNHTPVIINDISIENNSLQLDCCFTSAFDFVDGQLNVRNQANLSKIEYQDKKYTEYFHQPVFYINHFSIVLPLDSSVKLQSISFEYQYDNLNYMLPIQLEKDKYRIGKKTILYDENTYSIFIK